MKRYIILAVLLVVSSNLLAQSLTRDQTITYLLEKLKETEDLKRTYSSEFTYTHINIQFKKSSTNANRVLFQYERNFSDNTKDKSKFEFFPQYIKSVEKNEGKPGDAVAFLVVNFTAKNSVHEFTSTSGRFEKDSVESLVIPYLIADALHFERMSKALLHLRDVTIASMAPDPFVP